jgi:transketolase
MAAAVTGMAVHGGLVPYASTFLSFADYMRPSIRLASLSKAHVIYVWTHDSLALGEDGPTHQPVEHLASLRAIPGMLVLRPSDATETVEAWRVALSHRDGPVGLVLTRQKLPVLDRDALTPASGLAKGAYVLAEHGAPPDVSSSPPDPRCRSRSPRTTCCGATAIASRVVSMPSWELFEAQPRSYRDAVLPPHVRARGERRSRVALRVGALRGPRRRHHRRRSVRRVGTGAGVMREYGFTAEHIVAAAKTLLASRA